MWQPSGSLETLIKRAGILEEIRSFFKERSILEVETPILSQASVPDPNLQSFSSYFHPAGPSGKSEKLFMQTSPEFAMKRLLASGSGSIYQITKSFRDGEVGRYHNPEFTMLEWYRVGWDHRQLMQEVDELLQRILGCSSSPILTYYEIFQEFCQLNPHIASETELKEACKIHGIVLNSELSLTRDDYCHLLMSHVIEPRLGVEVPIFITDYPASQACLARVSKSDTPVAERFEVYFRGIELANGFHELTDSLEQALRFDDERKCRNSLNLPDVPRDDRLIAALEYGMPESAGVALGIDRLVMLALNLKTVQEVLTFPIDRA